MRRARDRRDSPLAARRPAPCAGLVRGRGACRVAQPARRDSGRSRRSRGSSHSRRTSSRSRARAAGDGALGRARGGSPPHARRAGALGARSARVRRRRRGGGDGEGEVVLVMGIPGAGKSRVAAEIRRRAATCASTATSAAARCATSPTALDEQLSAGARRVVLDNTYLTRASRSYVDRSGDRHGLGARCVWLDTPLAQAQVNLVERLLGQFGSLPTPEELRARRGGGRAASAHVADAGGARARAAVDRRGLAGVERRAVRARGRAPRRAPGVFVAAAALRAAGLDERARRRRPGCAAPRLRLAARRARGRARRRGRPPGGRGRRARSRPRVCPHGGGPPVCWCRPPLPGLPLAFARAHAVDPARSILVGTSPAHRTLAAALGARLVWLSK